jgi:hypothetical protein
MTQNVSVADLKNLPGVSYNSSNPEQLQSQLLDRKDAIYRQTYAPRERALIGTLNDNSLIDEARQNTNQTFDRNSEAGARNLRRYGMSVTPEQRAQLDKNTQSERTLNYDASLNDARLEQNERNTSLRNAMINVGRGIESDGATSLSEAAQRQASRDSSYKVAKAQASAQQTQMMVGLGSAALMAFAL